MISWQDVYFAAAGLLYSVVMIPSIRNPRTEIPRRSSVLTAVTLSASALAYASLGMWLASASTAIGAGVWAFLARYRALHPLTFGRLMMLTEEREINMIEQYRAWRLTHVAQELAGKVLGPNNHGGCGSCPSNGGCSSQPNYDADA